MPKSKDGSFYVIAVYNVGNSDWEGLHNFIGFLRPNYDKKPYPLTEKLSAAMKVQTERLGHKRGKKAVKFLWKRNRSRPWVEPNYLPFYAVRKIKPIRY